MAAEREGKEVEGGQEAGMMETGGSQGVAKLMGDFGDFETRMKHTTRVSSAVFDHPTVMASTQPAPACSNEGKKTNTN